MSGVADECHPAADKTFRKVFCDWRSEQSPAIKRMHNGCAPWFGPNLPRQVPAVSCASRPECSPKTERIGRAPWEKGNFVFAADWRGRGHTTRS